MIANSVTQRQSTIDDLLSITDDAAPVFKIDLTEITAEVEVP